MEPLQETINTFDKYADDYNRRYMHHAPYVETYRLLSGLLPDDASILDAACGPGNIARFLLSESPGRKLHGIDLSPNMIALARNNNPTATFEVMDCRQIFSLGQRYDAIVAGFCLPYLTREEVVEFIGETRNILNAGGIFYLSFMEGDPAASGLQTRNNIDWVCMYYHNTDLMLESLQSAGFEVMDVIRKAFKRDGEPDTTDIFIYARLT